MVHRGRAPSAHGQTASFTPFNSGFGTSFASYCDLSLFNVYSLIEEVWEVWTEPCESTRLFRDLTSFRGEALRQNILRTVHVGYSLCKHCSWVLSVIFFLPFIFNLLFFWGGRAGCWFFKKGFSEEYKDYFQSNMEHESKYLDVNCLVLCLFLDVTRDVFLLIMAATRVANVEVRRNCKAVQIHLFFWKAKCRT